jgi:hypothetical protein
MRQFGKVLQVQEKQVRANRIRCVRGEGEFAPFLGMMSSSDGLSATKTVMNIFAACNALLHVGERGISWLDVCGASKIFVSV